MSLANTVSFSLPRGYQDASGQIHQDGQMRLATALDEIECVQDPRVLTNEAYLPVVLLSRVITQLGTVGDVTPEVIASLYVIDLAYLEELYQRLNSPEPTVMGTVCPKCSEQFQIQVSPIG